jgi:3-hydroxyisobutyrate dehydrogenase-like beta-hydroxyacid dehydrogenase
MVGVTLAGLAEGMALADRAGLQQKDVLEVKYRYRYTLPIEIRLLIEKGPI